MLTSKSSVEGIDCDSPSAEHATSHESAEGFAGRQDGHPVVIAASAQPIDGPSSLSITRLSHRGVRLQGRNVPTPDRDVLITTGSLAVFAVVTWSEKDECDLRFVPPLDPELLALFEPEGKWATVMGII